MKCHKCKKNMEHRTDLVFNENKIEGWVCSCGEKYYSPEQAQKILILNKLKNEVIKAKLGRIRSNLILRLPKEVEFALGLKEGESVTIKLEDNGIRIIST